MSALEVWGGAECTINRVGDRFFDQVGMTGHDTRPSDLADLFSLGITRLRVPVLWERIFPIASGPGAWAWSDAYLAGCRAHGIRPIVGLLHHGGGPSHTSLLDPLFPEKFARYARAVARRYPWVTDWVPINEPLTTARFSCLYGHWYPHLRDERSMVVALVHQVRAIGLAMQAIREIVPHARLLQTEDIGRACSSPLLRYQRDYENARRWWSLDLLHGNGAVHDVLARILGDDVAAQRVLCAISASPCSADIIGIDHYVTSNRHLDERVTRFPNVRVGGNGRHAYVDVEAVRVPGNQHVGFGAIIDEVWARYRRPLALTEVQLGCTREEQMRWLSEAWSQCCARRQHGIEVVAITPWALFGSMDWCSLVTRDAGRYEVGAFDVRSERPRRTALAGMIQGLAGKAHYEHPVLKGAGWWRTAAHDARPQPWTDQRTAPILLLGASGTLGREILRHCARRNLPVVGCSRGAVDIAEGPAIERAILDHQPWCVINASGYSRVQRAESEVERCIAINERGAANVARACARSGLPLLTYSTHMVFGGDRRGAYREGDKMNPQNTYARSKSAGESQVRTLHARALVVRSGPFLGAGDGNCFVETVMQHLAAGRRLPVSSDLTVSPAYLPDLVEASLDLLIDDESGIWHMCNRGSTTWLHIAMECAERAGMDSGLICPVRHADRPSRARLPLNTALESNRGNLLPGLDSVLDRMFEATKFPRTENLGAAA